MTIQQGATNKVILLQVKHARTVLEFVNKMKVNGTYAANYSRAIGTLECAVKVLADNVEALVTGEPNRYASLCGKCWRTTMHDSDAMSFLCDTCEEQDLARRADERRKLLNPNTAYHASLMCVHNQDVKCEDEYCH